MYIVALFFFYFCEKNASGISMEIALTRQIAAGSVDILIIAIL